MFNIQILIFGLTDQAMTSQLQIEPAHINLALMRQHSLLTAPHSSEKLSLLDIFMVHRFAHCMNEAPLLLFDTKRTCFKAKESQKEKRLYQIDDLQTTTTF